LSNKILIVTTNVDSFDDVGFKTGLWLGELVHFWQVIKEGGYEADIVSPAGGKVPLDPQSLILPHMASAVGLKGKVTNQYKDTAFRDLLNNTKSFVDIDVDDYVAIYLTGGHGVMFDYPNDEQLQTLIRTFYDKGKVVSAVCHGSAGLLNVKHENGQYLIHKKRVTGYSWREEKLANVEKFVPFNLELEMKKRGARYRKNKIPFLTKVVKDGRLITGQNPKSTTKVAKTVVKLLRKLNKKK